MTHTGIVAQLDIVNTAILALESQMAALRAQMDVALAQKVVLLAAQGHADTPKQKRTRRSKEVIAASRAGTKRVPGLPKVVDGQAPSAENVPLIGGTATGASN